MEIKWEKMDYIAFILLGMLTIFYGNKQLQQLVAGLYIALVIWYVYTIIYEVKRYRQQEKDINSFAECLENVKKVQRIPDDIEIENTIPEVQYSQQAGEIHFTSAELEEILLIFKSDTSYEKIPGSQEYLISVLQQKIEEQKEIEEQNKKKQAMLMNSAACASCVINGCK